MHFSKKIYNFQDLKIIIERQQQEISRGQLKEAYGQASNTLDSVITEFNEFHNKAKVIIQLLEGIDHLRSDYMSFKPQLEEKIKLKEKDLFSRIPEIDDNSNKDTQYYIDIQNYNIELIKIKTAQFTVINTDLKFIKHFRDRLDTYVDLLTGKKIIDMLINISVAHANKSIDSNQLKKIKSSIVNILGLTNPVLGIGLTIANIIKTYNENFEAIAAEFVEKKTADLDFLSQILKHTKETMKLINLEVKDIQDKLNSNKEDIKEVMQQIQDLRNRYSV